MVERSGTGVLSRVSAALRDRGLAARGVTARARRAPRNVCPGPTLTLASAWVPI